MYKNILALMYAVTILILPAGSAAKIPSPVSPAKQLIVLADQKNERAAVYDLNHLDLDKAPVWECVPGKPTCTNISDAKYRSCALYGDVVITCASGGYAGIFSYPEGKELWSTKVSGNNPHSIELLPNGNIAVAASTGKTVRVYAASQAGENAQHYVETELSGAHGVLWDPENSVLWALGDTELCAYTVGGTDAEPTLTRVDGKGSDLPASGGHDLAPVYGDNNLLWISTVSGVYQYNKSENAFSDEYLGSFEVDMPNVKGIGNFADTGTLVKITPNGTYKTWDTNEITYYTFDPSKKEYTEHTASSETGAFYKIRVFDKNYQ